MANNVEWLEKLESLEAQVLNNGELPINQLSHRELLLLFFVENAKTGFDASCPEESRALILRVFQDKREFGALTQEELEYLADLAENHEAQAA